MTASERRGQRLSDQRRPSMTGPRGRPPKDHIERLQIGEAPISKSRRQAAMNARDIMSTPVLTVHPDTPLREIARLLLDKGISAVPVVDGNGAPVGIVSEGDLIHPDPRRARSPAAVLVGDVS